MSETELQTADESVEPSESAPETELENEGVEPTETKAETNGAAEPGDPDRFAQRINQKHFEAQEARRKAEELAAENARLKALLPQEQRPVVPELPDPYDADYAVKIQEHTEAVAKAAAFDADQKVRTEAEQAKAVEAQRKVQQEWVTRAQTYTETAKTLGVSPEKLQLAGQTVAAYGVSNELTQHILEDDKGPLITQHLATHPEELEKIVSMTPTRAAVYLETVVKPKASVSSGVSGAPEPVESLGGGGAPPAQRGPEGATFT